MADPPPNTMGEQETPIRSWLVWHAVIRVDPEAREHHDALTQLWTALATKLTTKRLQLPLDFPSIETLEQEDGYALLAFRREPREADYDYAYAYFEHDVVGIVVLFQSTTENDFEALQSKLPKDDCACVPALRRFVTLVSLTDQPTLPTTLASEVYDPEGFPSKDGFTLWHLKPDKTGVLRLLVAAPTAPSAQRSVQRFLLGPEANACPPMLKYQVHAAKLHWMNQQFREKYGTNRPESLRGQWQAVDAELKKALQPDVVDMSALLLRQQREGALTFNHRQLKEWLITLEIVAYHLGRLQTVPAGDWVEPFDLYQRDQECSKRLRFAIDMEIAYIEAAVDRTKAVQTVHRARLEEQRLATERERLKTETERLKTETERLSQEQESQRLKDEQAKRTEKDEAETAQRAKQEKDYHSLVQNSILGGMVLGLTAIQATGEYAKSEVRWPLVAFFGALGFALPIWAVRKSPKEKRGADRWGVSLVSGTFVALALSFLWGLVLPGGKPMPLWDVCKYGMLVCFLVFLLQERFVPWHKSN